MDLLVDVGNTRIKWAWADSRAPHRIGWAWTDTDSIESVLERDWRPLAVPSAVWVSSVARHSKILEIQAWVARAWSIPVYFARSTAQAFGVTNGYRDPDQLGVDRWLALVGAMALGLVPAVIADCGTALTIDLLTGDGAHLGGLIAPGLTLMRNSLTQNTANLPSILSSTDAGLGRTTGEAIYLGTLQCSVALISKVYSESADWLGGARQLIITGGDAAAVASLITFPVKIVPSLVFAGLARAAESELECKSGVG